MSYIVYSGTTTQNGITYNIYNCNSWAGSNYYGNQTPGHVVMAFSTGVGTACSCGGLKGYGDPACSGLGLFTTTTKWESFCNTCQTAYQAPLLMTRANWPKFNQCGAKNEIITEEVYNEIISQLNAFYNTVRDTLTYLDPDDNNKRKWVGGITYPDQFQNKVNTIPTLVNQSSGEIITTTDVSLEKLTDILGYFSDFENRQNATTPTESEQIYGEYTSQIQTYMKNNQSGKNTLKFQYPAGLKYLACNCEKVCYDDCHGHAGY